MPFTFSHPSIVLPLMYFPKRWVSSTGLIVGSMIPDFEYFIRMKPHSDYSHTLGGIFWFSLPLALVVSFIFHLIVRNTLYDNLPAFFKSRFVIFKQFDWISYFKKNWITVIISILIGIITHLFWDSFTHNGAYFVQRIPFLERTFSLFNVEVPVFKFLQHGSTLLGAIIIFYVVWKLPKNNNEALSNKWYWLGFSLLVILIVSIRLIAGLDYKLYGQLIVSFITALILSLILTPLFLKFRNLSHL
ncbi:MAG: DUF4184 family protein [Dysgonomonas sp.]